MRLYLSDKLPQIYLLLCIIRWRVPLSSENVLLCWLRYLPLVFTVWTWWLDHRLIYHCITCFYKVNVLVLPWYVYEFQKFRSAICEAVLASWGNYSLGSATKKHYASAYIMRKIDVNITFWDVRRKSYQFNTVVHVTTDIDATKKVNII